MKNIKKWMVYGLCTLVWTGIIFSFSLQNATRSASISGGLLSMLLSWWHSFTGIHIPMETVHTLFRKVAHLSEFFLLGIFSSLTVKHLKKTLWLSLGYCALVAITDESLQFFTGSGRAMRISDMGIDMAGAVLAVLLVLFFAAKSKRRTKKM